MGSSGKEKVFGESQQDPTRRDLILGRLPRREPHSLTYLPIPPRLYRNPSRVLSEERNITVTTDLHTLSLEPESDIANRLKSERVTRRTVIKVLGTALGTGLAVGGDIGAVKVADKLGLISMGLVFGSNEGQMHFPEGADSYQQLATLYNNMLTNFSAGNDLLFGRTRKADGWFKHTYAGAWPFGRAVDALYTMAQVSGLETQGNAQYLKRRKALESYWHEREGMPSSYDPGLPNQRFFAKDEALTDDNLWIGLMMMREYKKTGNRALLRRAGEIFELAVSQWDYDRGGIYWKVQLPGEDNTERGIVSNATAVMLGAQLAQETTDSRYKVWYKAWSEDIFNWTQTLKDPKEGEEGLYSDKHFFDKELRIYDIYTKKWTYTQGIMIGAMVKLHEMNPEKYSLQAAVDHANACFTYFDRKDQELREHDHASKADGYEGNEFNAIFFSNLLYLVSSYGDPDFTRSVQYALKKRVSRLQETYEELLPHAGAVQLTALSLVPEERYKELI